MSEARRNGQEPLESWLKSLPCAESFFAYYLYCYTASSSCWQPNRSKLQQRFPFIQSAVNNIMVMFLALDLVKSVESLCFWGVVSGVASAMHWHQEAARIQHPRGLQHAQGYQRKGFCQSLFFLKYIQQAFSCVLPLVSFLLLRDWCLLFVIRSLRIFFSPGNIQAFRRISQPGGKSNLRWSLVYLVLVRFSWVNRLCASGLYTEGVGRVCGWRKSLDKMSACADECPQELLDRAPGCFGFARLCLAQWFLMPVLR